MGNCINSFDLNTVNSRYYINILVLNQNIKIAFFGIMVVRPFKRYTHELTMSLKITLCTHMWYSRHISKQIRAMTYLNFGLFVVWWIFSNQKYHSIEQRLNQFIIFVLLASSPFNCRPPSPGLGGFWASWKKNYEVKSRNRHGCRKVLFITLVLTIKIKTVMTFSTTK